MRALILVVSAEKKGVSSTTGMQTTVQTSSLFKTRAEVVVPKRMAEMEKAIVSRDFPTFAQLTMRESNSFHATCLDTDPPIFYLNDVSRAAIRAVEIINETVGRIVCAYTFDAGPNAVIYHLENDWNDVVGTFEKILGVKEGLKGGNMNVEHGVLEGNEAVEEILRKGVSRVIQTMVGDGPRSVDDHLIDEHGKPVS